LCCAAQLILDYLERGLYPSWDAQNPASVALSEKLGYHFDKEYTVCEVYKYTRMKKN
ncbi:GNAT family N-acetyltransferase, partial [Blautia pseudococcoides]|nr:GNAT family N-acetyltransferase [Blautia pseudococcoides]